MCALPIVACILYMTLVICSDFSCKWLRISFGNSCVMFEEHADMVACRKVGWDKEDVWFAHCCCLNDAETHQWATDGVGIAHCPSSNMRLASGIAPVSLDIITKTS